MTGKATLLIELMEAGAISQRELTAVEFYYGLNGREHMAVREIAKRYGVTRSRVYQILGDARRKLIAAYDRRHTYIFEPLDEDSRLSQLLSYDW